MTTKNTLMPKLAVIHNHGATFAYEPVGDTQVSILFGLSRTKDGPKFYRQSERGPWGSTALIKQGKEVPNEQWAELMQKAVDQSYVLLKFLEGNLSEEEFLKDFDAQIIDQRTSAAA